MNAMFIMIVIKIVIAIATMTIIGVTITIIITVVITVIISITIVNTMIIMIAIATATSSGRLSDLTDEETDALARLLRDRIDAQHYPLAAGPNVERHSRQDPPEAAEGVSSPEGAGIETRTAAAPETLRVAARRAIWATVKELFRPTDGPRDCGGCPCPSNCAISLPESRTASPAAGNAVIRLNSSRPKWQSDMPRLALSIDRTGWCLDCFARGQPAEVASPKNAS
jgi:hypothetical protein